MDPTTLSIDPTSVLPSGTTDYSGTDGGGSNGLDLNSLMSNLIGTAGQSYIANQTAQQNAAIAQAQAQQASVASSVNPLAVLMPNGNPDYLVLGLGLLLLVALLRK